MNINEIEKELIITALKQLSKNIYVESADNEKLIPDLIKRLEDSDYSLNGLGSENYST